MQLLDLTWHSNLIGCYLLGSKITVRLSNHVIYSIEIKPFGLEFENSRCLFTEFAILIHFGRKKFFLQKDRQTDTHSLTKTETRTDIVAKIVV